jgi:hypothetical protein
VKLTKILDGIQKEIKSWDAWRRNTTPGEVYLLRKRVKLVSENFAPTREIAKRLRSDANLDGCIHESQYFLIQDALDEAYRLGTIEFEIAVREDMK